MGWGRNVLMKSPLKLQLQPVKAEEYPAKPGTITLPHSIDEELSRPDASDQLYTGWVKVSFSQTEKLGG